MAQVASEVSEAAERLRGFIEKGYFNAYTRGIYRNTACPAPSGRTGKR